MSGRMLYQRSGMSSSLSRIFFATGSSLLYDGRQDGLRPAYIAKPRVSRTHDGPHGPAVALFRRGWAPALMAVPGCSAPDQIEPRSSGVSATGWRLPAAALDVRRPPHR